MNTAKEFVETLLKALPELDEAYKKHIGDYSTLLPHVFMADVTRLVMDATRQTSEWSLLKRLLLIVEQGLQSTEADVLDLLQGSFIENLCEETETTILLPGNVT